MHCAEIALVDYGSRLEHLWRYLYAVRNINTCAPNTHLHRGSTGIETIASRREQDTVKSPCFQVPGTMRSKDNC